MCEFDVNPTFLNSAISVDTGCTLIEAEEYSIPTFRLLVLVTVLVLIVGDHEIGYVVTLRRQDSSTHSQDSSSHS